jgi:hypothetical protein
MLDRGGVLGSLTLTVGCMSLTALFTLPFLRSRVARSQGEQSAPDVQVA